MTLQVWYRDANTKWKLGLHEAVIVPGLLGEAEEKMETVVELRAQGLGLRV